MDEPPLDFEIPESPLALRRRLKASGQWSKAHIKMVDVRYKYWKKHDPNNWTFNQKVEVEKMALDAAWDMYPPPPDAVPCMLAAHVTMKPPSTKSRGRVSMRLSAAAEARFEAMGDNHDIHRDTVWVYNNFKNASVSPFDCPSRGAWSLLQEARKEPKWFLKDMYKTVANDAAKRKDAETTTISKQEKYCREELKKMLEAAKEEMANAN